MFDFPQAYLPHWLLYLLIALLFTFYQLLEKRGPSVEARLGFRYLSFTPRFIANFIYGIKGKSTIDKAYRLSGGRPFKLIRNDVDMCVMPASAVEEICSLPIEVASGIKALEHDLLGKWTGLSIILESRLHHRVVLRKLTPNLTSVVPSLEDEIKDAISTYLPSETTEWVRFNPYHNLLKVSSRVSSRVLIGFPICRDPRWTKLSIDFTENIFASIVIMRFFPSWMYGLLGFVLPSCWYSKAHIRKSKELLAAAFQERLDAIDNGSYKPGPSHEECGFEWLSEIAEGSERDANKLAHYEILLALASIHTTLLRELNVLYDLMENPAVLEELRQEIEAERRNGWTKSSYFNLTKMDSVLRESQRMTPPTMIGLRRIMQQDYTMQDGTFLPKGSYICVPTWSIENDTTFTDDPECFDGLRNFRSRVKHDSFASTRYQFTSTEKTVLGFGHGKTACPGRFFASLAIKAVFVKLLTEYDFQFVSTGGGRKRPKNLLAHEFVFPQRGADILIKRRTGYTAPF